jgi:L,D-peptidoglycan transpeptidase YkuD (ErfK/YbiS/YcfS/YnhG family)
MVEDSAAHAPSRRGGRQVRRWRRRFALLVVLAGSVLLSGAVPGATALAGASPGDLPRYHPSRLAQLGDAGQVVVVTGRSWSSSHAVLRRYQRTADGRWRRVGDGVAARVGRRGFVLAEQRRQSTGTSPAGTFGLVSAFGNGPDPGTALPYHAVDRSDWWVYDPRDPSTYNVLQPRRVATSAWRRSWAEDLSGYGGQYRYVAVLDFNLPVAVTTAADGQRVATQPADTRLGGGIFLHVSGPGATAGCVSVRRATMRRTLRWLDPAQHPVIVMGPRSAIDRL